MLMKIYNRLKKMMWKAHPYDSELGIETTSYVAHNRLLSGDGELDEANNGYAAAHPSVIRRAIEKVPTIAGTTFVDLGCGKGRVLVTATEYPFAQIIGIEIGEPLVVAARHNAEQIAARFPDRTPIEIRLGDATQIDALEGDVVLFLYNSFRTPLVARLLESIERWSAEHPDNSLYLLYLNPVNFALVDQMSLLERFDVDRLEFTEDEKRVHMFANVADALVVYRLRGRDAAPVHDTIGRRLQVTIPHTSCELVDA